VNLLNKKLVNVLKIIWDNRHDTERLDSFMKTISEGMNKRKEDKSMNNKLMVFNNSEFGEIRSITIDDEPYFIGNEIATILGYKNSRDALIKHVDKEDIRPDVAIHDGSQTRYVTMINESGLYSLIMSSKLPKAKQFKRWVTSEVLPSIRKNGSYDIDTNGLMKQLTQSQITLNNVFAGFKMQIDKGFEETNSKLNEHDELLKKRVYLSPKEAKDVQVAIRNKAKAIAIINNLPYDEVKGKLFKRLYTQLNELFEVGTYRELPSIRYEDIIDTIANLTIPIRDIQNETYQISL